MKSIFKEFCCPQCGELRYINVDGVCFDCKNHNDLLALIEKRKMQQDSNQSLISLSVENYF